MAHWFMLAGNEPEKLQKTFLDFFSGHHSPEGIALWKWKRSYWICSPEKYKQKILTTFAGHGIIEFSSAPSPVDIEFVSGDKSSLST
jgi:hypothetical protein